MERPSLAYLAPLSEPWHRRVETIIEQTLNLEPCASSFATCNFNTFYDLEFLMLHKQFPA